MALNEIVEIFSYIATILGIPIAIILFINEKRKERRDREYGTYHALDEKYHDYLKLCMENPELDLYDRPIEKKVQLTAEQKIRQYAMFEILVSLLERAFLMYHDQASSIKKAQWEGWNLYMQDYARSSTFGELWKLRGTEFDEDFTNHMNKIFETIASE
jgi:hypothetical protein